MQPWFGSHSGDRPAEDSPSVVVLSGHLVLTLVHPLPDDSQHHGLITHGLSQRSPEGFPSPPTFSGLSPHVVGFCQVLTPVGTPDFRAELSEARTLDTGHVVLGHDIIVVKIKVLCPAALATAF